MAKITFVAEDEKFDVEATEGENLMKVARRGGVVIYAPCDGGGSCGRCKVKLTAGTLKSPKPFLLSDVDYEEGTRLACLSTVNGDCTIEVDC
ncbi:MAG: 2Fe-2S iron-sulfur cluster binding domain-containing protein [Clostridia bacterium]|nr:2Fe-2S iron-sulfur cluster binding domain-containing protein [Clostridia bacterium]